MATKAEIEDEIVRILVALRVVPDADRERHTVLTRDLAQQMLSLREHYLTGDGKPDWSGKTFQYRSAVKNLYSRADYGAEEKSVLQNTVRYHLGNLIRRHVSPAELEDAGISAPSPHERQAARRQSASAIIAASATDATDPDAPLTDKVAELRTVLATLTRERINKRRVAAPENAEAVDAFVRLLGAIRDRAEALVGEVERARS